MDNVKHPISTKEGFRHSLSAQEGQKPLTCACEGRGAMRPVQWGLMYSPVSKSNSATDMDILNCEEELEDEAMLGPYEPPPHPNITTSWKSPVSI
ncbi:hypothetical protein A6R68_13597, partial [Neotoma lepida]